MLRACQTNVSLIYPPLAVMVEKTAIWLQVIMLVESPDGRRALLGRSRKVAPGMYTCLSGFVDQCESVEEVRHSTSHTTLELLTYYYAGCFKVFPLSTTARQACQLPSQLL